MRRSKIALIALSLSLLLTSCFRLEQSVKVHDDGRMNVSQVVAADLDAIDPDAIGGSGSSLPDAAAELYCEGLRDGFRDAVPNVPGSEVDNYKDGDYCGVQVNVAYPAAPDHSAALTSFFTTTTRLVKGGAGWEFETSVAPQQLTAGSAAAAGSGLGSAEADELFGSGEITLRVELPGQAIEGEHNASSVSGGTFVWNIDPQSPPSRLFAMTEPATGLNKLPVSPKVIGVVLVNLAVIAGVAWFFMRPEEPVEEVVRETNDAVSEFGAPMPTNVEPGTPYYDESYGIWMLQDPARGLLWHREGTDEWVPF